MLGPKNSVYSLNFDFLNFMKTTMVTLIKTSLLFFFLFKIICITSPMNVWRMIGSSSSSSSTKDPKESCLSELQKIFKDNSGLDNFLFALLNLNEESFKNDEQCLAKRYFENMFDTLNKIATDVPDLRTPRDYCHQIVIENQAIRNKCTLVIKANTGCEADFEGADCIKYMYRNWKEYNGALPGTEELTDNQLLSAIRRKYGHRFPEDISDSDLMDELRRERNDYGGILGERLYPEDLSDEDLLYDIRGTAILDEYDRRMSLPEYFFLGSSYLVSFDKLYAINLRDAMHNFGGSAFSDPTDFCVSYLSEQQRLLTINEQMDPYNYDTDDSYP